MIGKEALWGCKNTKDDKFYTKYITMISRLRLLYSL